MDPSTHSSEWPDGLGLLAAAVDQLATDDPETLSDSEAAQRVLILRELIDRLEGVWLRDLAGVDGRGAAGAEVGVPAESTRPEEATSTRSGRTATATRLGSVTATRPAGWRPGRGPPGPCCLPCWVVPPANRWTWAMPPGSSPRPNAPR